MPAQKRPPPPPPPPSDDEHHHHLVMDGQDEENNGSPPASPAASQLQQQQKQEEDEPPQLPEERKKNDSDDEIGDDGTSPSSSSCTATPDKDGFIIVKLADIRKEVQCPICLGIIRKTRTVMECLHRFCRECIDKSMRLGNNECPACRTHCASRRSLRDDPNYDALIGILYPDIDKYEEEELAFHDEEKTRNKRIQASIAETLRRQTEALGRRRSAAKATAVAFARRSIGNFRNNHLRGRRYVGRDTGLVGSDDDDEEEDTNGNEGGKDSSSADEPSPDVRQKRCKRARRSSPSAANFDGGFDEIDDIELGKETLGASPGRGNREMLVWGKGGARSQTRHGGVGGNNGKNFKGNRINKLVDYLRNMEENNELDVNLTLVPMDKQSMPGLPQPFICCSPTLSVRHICQFIATQLSAQAEEIEILFIKPRIGTPVPKPSTAADDPVPGPSDPPVNEELQILGAQESLDVLHTYFSSSRANLVLGYRSKTNS